MYCIDSDILIEFLKGNKSIVKKISDILESEDIYVTTITLCEIFKGVYLSPDFQDEAEKLSDALESLAILPVDFNNAKEFGRLYSQLRRKGRSIGEFDIIISAIAKVHGLILITGNKKHFENTGVQIKEW